MEKREITKLAYELIRKYQKEGLVSQTLEFRCSYSIKTNMIGCYRVGRKNGRPFQLIEFVLKFKNNSDESIKQILLHEIAHAIVYHTEPEAWSKEDSHGPTYTKIAQMINCIAPEATGELIQSYNVWQARCCGTLFQLKRIFKNKIYRCPVCKTQVKWTKTIRSNGTDKIAAKLAK